MTNEEAKAAWRSQSKVYFDGVPYTVQSLVYRYPNKLFVELLDKNKNSIVVASPDRVTTQEQRQNTEMEGGNV